jgi:hypothetical protein
MILYWLGKISGKDKEKYTQIKFVCVNFIFQFIDNEYNGNRILSPLRKVINIKMPLRLKGSKVHKEMIIKCLNLVILCVFVPL